MIHLRTLTTISVIRFYITYLGSPGITMGSVQQRFASSCQFRIRNGLIGGGPVRFRQCSLAPPPATHRAAKITGDLTGVRGGSSSDVDVQQSRSGALPPTATLEGKSSAIIARSSARATATNAGCRRPTDAVGPLALANFRRPLCVRLDGPSHGLY